jgi:hypothetical protein
LLVFYVNLPDVARGGGVFLFVNSKGNKDMPGVKGKTNNPHGRPLGALNALAREHLVTVNKLLSENIDKVGEELQKLNGSKLVQFYIDLLKFVVPPAPPHVIEEEDSGSDLEERVLEAAQ